MLMTLPTELIITVLQFTSFKDIGQCAQVCTALRNITTQSAALQYLVELGLSGLCDGPPELGYAVTDRLKILRRQEAAWWNLSWSNRERIPINGTTSSYDMHGGVWARGGGARYGGLTLSMEVFTLPSTIVGTASQAWSLSAFRENCCAYSVDARQNLLIWVENNYYMGNGETTVALHICTLTEGTEHPMAQLPIIKRNVSARVPEYKISIINNLVAVGLDRSGLLIWDWQLGELICFQSVDRERFYEFSFISSTSFLLCLSNMAAFDPRSAVIELYSLENLPAIPGGSARHVATFGLPGVKPNVYVRLRCRSDPPPSDHTTYRWPDTSLPRLKPFSVSPESRILELSFRVSKSSTICNFTIIIPARVFLSRLKGRKLNAMIPWDEWGLETRWINPHHALRDDWISYVHGSRYAELIPAARANHHHLVVYDFNPHVVRLASMGGDETQYDNDLNFQRFYSTDSDLETELMDDEEHFYDPEYFRGVISRGRAPCRVSISGPFKGSTSMSVAIDDERMILIELESKFGRHNLTAISVYTP